MNSTTLQAEKRGNANFVQCPKCAQWFAVGASLLARTEIPLHCPHCQHEFPQHEAARVARAG